MKITARTYLFAVLMSFMMVSGCKKPGPIELNIGQSALQLTALPSSSTFLLTTSDIDTLGYFPPIEDVAMSHLLLEKSEFDAVGTHHDALLARALFLNPNVRVILPKDTVYRTFDVGTVAVDLLVLRKVEKRYPYSVPSGDSTITRDTLAGPQYALYAVDGIGGGGISYDVGRVYTWTGSGSGAVPRFTATMTAPDTIHITTPSEFTPTSISTGLKILWNGGGDTVRILIREWDGRKIGKSLEILVIGAGGHYNISRSVFDIVPIHQGKFLLTLSSSTRAFVRPAGFTAPILVQTVTSHNLVVQVKP